MEPSHFELLVLSVCSTPAARVRVHFVAAALPVGRLLHRSCSCYCAVRCACCAFAAGARLTALTVAAARPRLSLLLSGGPKFTAPQHLCRCHGVVRLPQLRAQLPCGTPFIYSHKHQVANTTRSRSIARAHIVMWTISECGGVLVRCVIKPCCTLESLTLHHCASPPTRPIVLLRVRVLLTRAPTPSTRPTTPLLPPPRALAPGAAVTVLRLPHSAALFLLTYLLHRVLRGLCCICCPTFSFVTAPPVMLWRHHAGPSATLTRPASYKVHVAKAPLLFPSSISWLFFFTFIGAPTTHVNSSISHNVFPFVR